MQASFVALLLHVVLMASSVVECAEAGQQNNGLNVVDVGRSVVFTCVSNNSAQVSWTFYPDPDGSRNYVVLYEGGRPVHHDDRYSIKVNIRGSNDLIIEHVTASAAGRYVCMDNDGFGPKLLDVDLVVLLDPDMSCSTNASVDGVVVEHDVVEYACELCYNGTAEPLFRWTDHNGNPLTSGMSVVPKNEVRCARSYVAVTVGTEKLGQVTCDVSFRTSTASTSSVRGRTFDELPVQFPVRNAIVTNATRSGVLHIHRSETLVCSADGQPEVEYRWTDVISGRQTDGDVLVLADTGKHEFQCSAWNVVRNVTHNVSCYVSVNVVEERVPMLPNLMESRDGDREPPTDNTIAIGLGVIGVACGLMLLVVVVLVAKKRSRRHHGESKAGDRDDFLNSPFLVLSDNRTNCILYEEIVTCRRSMTDDNIGGGGPAMSEGTSDYLTPSRSTAQQGVQYMHGETGLALGCHGPCGGSFDGRYFVQKKASCDAEPSYYSGNDLYGEEIRPKSRDDDGIYLHTLE